ncbi:hypothetical protein AB0M46_00710 [Dactylosporangium sp. NPDC051485]|uniref:hypothetical protein n=1 Tax=Dactylosporangium sp. NPDC051485 TaxID=3154846 RepID=UPI003448CCAA
MKLAWGRSAALLAAVSVVFAAGACGDKAGDGSTPAAAASSKPADPKETLLGSLKEYDKGVYDVAFTARDGAGSGSIDAPKKHAHIKISGTDADMKFSMELLVLEPEAYLKMDMGAAAGAVPGLELLNGKKWIHVDRSKIKDSQDLSLKADDADLTGIAALLKSAQGVQAAGDKKFTGTLDLGKGDKSPVTDEEVIKALGDKAASVPFTATLGADGQLSELVIDVPAAGDKAAHQLKLTVSNYGKATVPAAPTGADVVEPPASIYAVLNGGA